MRYLYTRENIEMRALLDYSGDDLSIDHISNDPVVGLPTIIGAGNEEVDTLCGITTVDLVSPYSVVETDVVRYIKDPVEEKQHRRVRNKKLYSQCVIAEVKVRFGTATRTVANERAVARFASEIMRKHGLRHTEARKLLPTIVQCIFVPDQWELHAAKLSSCSLASERRVKMAFYNAISGSMAC
jgi:hypothetical protein